jgi:ABC-2 type transport system permease protein
VFERIKHMLIKEFAQVFRDPKMRGVIFVMPVVQVLVFGYAVTTDVKHVATAVRDLDNSVAGRELIARFEKSGYFDIIEYVADDGRARELVDDGRVRAVLVINHGFEDDLRAGRTAQLQVIVDGTDSNTAGIVLDYSAKIARQFSQNVLDTRYARLKGVPQEPAQVAVQTRAWFNENLESRNFYVPGVIAIIVLLITLMLTSMAVVREKEIGTMEQIMVSPRRSSSWGKRCPSP